MSLNYNIFQKTKKKRKHSLSYNHISMYPKISNMVINKILKIDIINGLPIYSFEYEVDFLVKLDNKK